MCKLTVRDRRATWTAIEQGSEGDISTADISSGWATRKKKGKMYGKRYTGDYRTEILELYLLGEDSNANKRGPGAMAEALRLRHPNRFDLPTE